MQSSAPDTSPGEGKDTLSPPEELAAKLDQAGNKMAFEQVMAAVSDFEKGNMRLSVVLAALDVK